MRVATIRICERAAGRVVRRRRREHRVHQTSEQPEEHAGSHQVREPRVQRVFWAVAEGLVATALLLSGGLQALQTASIATGLLFSMVMLLMIVSLLKAFRGEPITPTVREREPDAPKETFGDVDHPRGAD